MEAKLDRILEEIENLKVVTEDTRDRLDPLEEKVCNLEERQEIVENNMYNVRCKIA